MSDKTVYIWSAFSNKQGLALGGPEDGKHISLGLFNLGMPLKQAYEKFLTFKGVHNALNGHHNDPNFIPVARRTVEWFEKPYPLPFVSTFKKEALEKMDVLFLDYAIPFVNEKVLSILSRLCPNEYEAFPIELYTPTGTSYLYFILNITHKIEDALDKPNCDYSIAYMKKEGDESCVGRFKRILFKEGCMKNLMLGRLYEDMFRVMVHKTIIDEFIKEKIHGFNVQIFENKLNGFFKSNYLPDGKTLKV